MSLIEYIGGWYADRAMWVFKQLTLFAILMTESLLMSSAWKVFLED